MIVAEKHALELELGIQAVIRPYRKCGAASGGSYRTGGLLDGAEPLVRVAK